MEAGRREGVELVGSGRLLTGPSKTALESALKTEMTEHLGYEAHDAAGRDDGNSRNGASGSDDDSADAAALKVRLIMGSALQRTLELDNEVAHGSTG